MLEIYVRANPKFLHSLMPIPVPEEPLVAKLMAQASEKAGVGPMAGVAGAIADLAVKDMKRGRMRGSGRGGWRRDFSSLQSTR